MKEVWYSEFNMNITVIEFSTHIKFSLTMTNMFTAPFRTTDQLRASFQQPHCKHSPSVFLFTR